MSRLRIPMVMVVILLGQDPQAPCSFRYTTGPSISESSTLPPSDMRYGRICKQQDKTSIDRHTFGPICVQQDLTKLVIFYGQQLLGSHYLVKDSFHIFRGQF